MRRRREELKVTTVVYRPDLERDAADDHPTRMALGRVVADIVDMTDRGGLILFPAGFFRVASPEARNEVAEEMLELSGAARVSLLFGVDVAEDHAWAPLGGRAEHFAFACDAGRPVLWPTAHVGGSHASEGPADERCVTLSGTRMGVVIGSEVFNAPLRRELTRGKPDAIALLTHVGPSERWQTALAGLACVGPVIVVGDSLTDQVPAWTEPPPGWVRTQLGGTPCLTLQRYHPLPLEHAIGRST